MRLSSWTRPRRDRREHLGTGPDLVSSQMMPIAN